MRRVALKRVKIPDSRLMLGPLPKKRIFQNLLGGEPVAERLRDFAAVPFADEEGTVPPAWEGSRAILSLAKLDFVWGPPVTSGCSCSFTAVRFDDRASRLRCRDDLGVRRDGCRRSAVGACMIVGAKETACISPPVSRKGCALLRPSHVISAAEYGIYDAFAILFGKMMACADPFTLVLMKSANKIARHAVCSR